MKSTDIENFIETNLKNFSLNGSGWHEIIRKMLFEFCISGYDMTQTVGGKEKFGELRCHFHRTGNNEIDQRINNISYDYCELSKHTCELCGNPGKHRSINYWEHTLCLIHYLSYLPAIQIEGDVVTIDDKAYKTYKFSNAKFETDYRTLTLYTSDLFGNSKIACIVSSQLPNYYKLLRTLLNYGRLLDQKQTAYLTHFFNSLSDCEICGRVSVFENSCRYCYNHTWETSAFKEDNKDEYIKISQMSLFIDEDDYMILFRKDSSFEKSENHQILYTKDELEKYIVETKQEEDDY